MACFRPKLCNAGSFSSLCVFSLGRVACRHSLNDISVPGSKALLFLGRPQPAKYWLMPFTHTEAELHPERPGNTRSLISLEAQL